MSCNVFQCLSNQFLSNRCLLKSFEFPFFLQKGFAVQRASRENDRPSDKKRSRLWGWFYKTSTCIEVFSPFRKVERERKYFGLTPLRLYWSHFFYHDKIENGKSYPFTNVEKNDIWSGKHFGTGGPRIALILGNWNYCVKWNRVNGGQF